MRLRDGFKALSTSSFLVLSSLLLSSCGGSGSAVAPSSVAQDVTFSGRASAGPINGGTVAIYGALSNGTRGSLIATTTTNATGNYSVSLPATSGAVFVVIRGGTYEEEGSGQTVSLGNSEIQALVSSSTADKSVSITPLTHIAAQRAVSLAGTGTGLTTAIANANQSITTVMGLSGVTDITSIVPALPTTSITSQGLSETSNEAKVSLFLAALSQYGDTNGVNSLAVMGAFAEDFLNDGVFDGSNGGSSVNLGGSSLGTSAWSSGVASAQTTFLNSGRNTAGFTNSSAVVPVADPSPPTLAAFEARRGFSIYTATPEALNAMVVQSDNKIVVGGGSKIVTDLNGTTRFVYTLARYLVTGALDTSFGNSGIVNKIFLDTNGQVNSLAQQSDGKILMLGQSGTRFVLARLASDGSLDSSFGIDGVVITSVGSASQIDTTYGTSVAIQADGKILVGGGVKKTNNQFHFMMARFTFSGQLDTTFNSTGYNIIDIGSSRQTYGRAVAVQSNGGLILAGTDQATSLTYVIRLTSAGAWDTNFGSSGVFTDTDMTEAASVGLMSDGKIVVGGNDALNSTAGILVLTTAGALSTYNTTGKAWATGVTRAGAGVKVLGDDSILLSGSNAATDFAVAKFDPTGTLDTSFSSDGIADGVSTGDMTTGLYEFDAALGVLSTGQIVVAGSVVDDNGAYDFAVQMFTSAGASDTTFSADGYVSRSTSSDFSGAGPDEGSAVALLANGKSIVVGSTFNQVSHDIFVAQYNQDGTLDTSFATNGYAVMGETNRDERPKDVVIQSDGKILIIATSDDGTNFLEGYLARFSAGGTLDTSFGTSGKTLFTISSNSTSPVALATQVDGKIVVAGTSIAGATQFFATRFAANGTLDTSYGTSGIWEGNFGDSMGDSTAYDATLQADGKLVIVGLTTANSAYQKAGLARLTTAGALDTTFDTDGFVKTELTAGAASFARSVLAVSEGKILIGGTGTIGSEDNYFVLARYSGNGSLDTSFGTNGTVSTLIETIGSSGFLAGATGLAVDSTGRILAGGFSWINNVGTGLTFTRYSANGALDSTFGTAGLKRIRLDESTGTVMSGMVQEPGGTLLTVGTVSASYDDEQRGDFGTDAFLTRVVP